MDTVNRTGVPKQVSRPISPETRPNTLHFHSITSFDVPQTRKQGAVLLRPFKHQVHYDAATAKAHDVDHARKYIQLRVGRAILAVQEKDEILVDGAAEAGLLAFAVQIELKYECAPALVEVCDDWIELSPVWFPG